MNSWLYSYRNNENVPLKMILCCLLGSAFLVYGQQTLTRLASPNEPNATDHTGEIISFSDVGSGVGTDPRAWYCYTYNTGSVVWQGPGMSELPIDSAYRDAVGDELFISGIEYTAVILHRGPTHFSPDGEHCCVRIAQGPAQRLCVTFTPCPTLSPQSNGRISYDATNNMATYTCNTGYTISGATPITCMSDGTSAGTWSPSPPTACALVDCGSPPTIGNGSPGTPTSTTYQGTVTYTCDTGYEVSNGVTIVTANCMASGMWETVATCSAVDCGSPLSIGNGSPETPTSTTLEGMVTYTCNRGYEVSNGVTTAMATCMASGMWEPVPTCSPVDCGSLDAPSNGTVKTSSGTTFMMTATYTCNTGYNIVGSDTRTCRADRIWTPEVPTCAPVDCGSLTVPNGQVCTSSGNIFESIATYICDDGYHLNRVTIRTCQANGTWSLTAPTCDPVDCGPLNETANGAVTTSSGTTFMMTATYTCNTGYSIVGSESRTCGASGTSGVWSGEAPVCNLIPLSNGSMNVIANNSVLSLAAIGSSALTCHTELTTCCRGVDNNGNALGGWRGPNGDSIPDSNTDGFYMSRCMSSISLNLAEGSSEVAGTYCCQVPRESGATTTHCVMVTASAVVNVVAVAVAGWVVAGVLTIAVLVLIVVMLRQRRSGSKDKSDERTGSQPTQLPPVVMSHLPSHDYEGLNKLQEEAAYEVVDQPRPPPPADYQLSACAAYASTDFN
ncbi:sushi, von Willebrand factor type A, EGF and pentraxin domain-containing protein 1-like isoform X2 [Halichondria panicea]|uniref:sushi, von Willebrand factor type A, EGF and pentraxin domain-containing protein 1-like isoform X2 n=1 Tax=Halichondria panicea TaxID=6063 RepID=UPI00312BC8F8